ncbi:MAG: pyridoxamine 5'-phosphate oxidase family protein [Sphingomonadaceae bacterium]
MIAGDSLDDVLSDVWSRWVRGGADRKSAFHTPVVASVDDAGNPQQRVMVLRKCDAAARMIRFHTDIRSAKVAQIGKRVSVIGYDPAAKIQIRVSGTAAIERDGLLADAAWAASNASSRRCYLAEPGPGTVTPLPGSGLPASVESRVPDIEETLPGRGNFAVMMVTLDSLEWLYLAHDGHRRARFVWDDDAWRGVWLIP